MWEPLALRNCVIILQQNITVIFTHTLDVKTVILHHNTIHRGTYIDQYSRSYNQNFRITPYVSNLYLCYYEYIYMCVCVCRKRMLLPAHS